MIREDIDISEVLENGFSTYNIVDVRSPLEYAEDHLPTAINIPILDNDERREVGIIYKQQGPVMARMRGVELLSPRLPQFIKDFYEKTDRRKKTVIYCWRGGLRSFAALNLTKIAGIKACRLTGGYKAFRKIVFDFFEDFPPYNFITFFGATGCAKSEILRELENKSCAMADLEKFASHKGSVFGSVDEAGYASVTQKKFETLLWNNFRNTNAETFLVEGESKKIGKVSIPSKMFNGMLNGVSVLAEVPLDFRIEFTVQNYKPDLYITEIRESLVKITRYLGKEKVELLSGLLDKNDFKKFTEILLVEYYDPMYRHSFPAKVDYVLKYSSIDEGVKLLGEIYENETKSIRTF